MVDTSTPDARAPTAKISDVVTTFRPARRFQPENTKTFVTSLDFDDTGELSVVARDDDTLHLYNCKSGKHAKELKSQKYGVHLARFTHNAQSLIYASTKQDGNSISMHSGSFSELTTCRRHPIPFVP